LRQQWRVSSGVASCRAVSKDSKTLAVGAGGYVYVWDISGEKPVQTGAFPISTSGIHDITISPDGKHLAAGVYDGLVHLFRLEGSKAKVRTQLSGHQAAVTAVRFAPNGVLTSASVDGVIHYWSVQGERIPDPLKVTGSKGIGKMDYAPNGTSLVISVGPDLEVWTPRAARRRAVLPKAHASTITHVNFSPAGYLATSSADGTAKTWNLAALRPITV